MRASDIEDRLEELFVSDSNSRKVAAVSAPERPSPWRGLVAFTGATVIAGVLALAVISALRSDPQAAAPTTTTTPLATATPTASPPPAAMGVVTGALGYPSDFIPALAIYALPTNNLADGRYMILTERSGIAPAGSVTYTMQVPAGTYYFVAYSREAPPGSALAGGYTRLVTCGMQAHCSDHTLVPVTVTAGQTVTNVDIRDWYLPPGETFPPRPR